MSGHQMNFLELTLNPSVEPQDEDRLSVQQMAIWKLFEKRENGRVRYVEVSTSQLREAAAQYSARVNEIRKWLQTYGLTIDRVNKNHFGNHAYRVVEFEGSRYQKHLQKRGLA